MNFFETEPWAPFPFCRPEFPAVNPEAEIKDKFCDPLFILAAIR